ncbi:MAG: family 10 glycosylhydrolase, partial [Planctomycetaceae bacterium]|nr:family 10 glycosylhydrolase [Planctomycetaceae bacterium]
MNRRRLAASAGMRVLSLWGGGIVAAAVLLGGGTRSGGVEPRRSVSGGAIGESSPSPPALLPEGEGRKVRRVLYNFDGDSCLVTRANSKGPVALNVDDLKQLVEEVAYDGSDVDTILVCINAQVMYYPTAVGTMRGGNSTPEERAKWPASEQQRFANVEAFFNNGVDPYAVILAEAKARGREALLSFRMNDDHGNDFLRTAFLAEHPEWRLGTVQYQGSGAPDFIQPEVRAYVLALIEEAVRRYDSDGIELDFNRFPNFFKGGTTDERVSLMNGLVESVRQMLDKVSAERRGLTPPLVLGVRVPSNYG